MRSMEEARLVVGVDMATQEARVACADPAGEVLGSAAVAFPAPESPRPGWSEQDAGGWWPSVASALRRLTDELGPQRRHIAALAVSATSGTVVLADGGADPLGPALMYGDQRAEAEAERARRAGYDRWEALGLRVSATFGLPKWAWLLDQGDARERARFAWHPSDLVVARLVGGPPPTDWSHALKSGYDPLRQEWAWEVIDDLAIPHHLLPEVRPPGTVAGAVSPSAAAETGLPAGCEVRLGMTDGCAGQLASGADQPGCFVSILGTTLVVKGAARERVKDASGAVYSHRHPDGWWLPGGASNTGGAALEEGFEGTDLADLDEQAAARGPAGCVVYPLCRRGERFPFVEPEAEGFVDGSPAGDGERYRATLEGVAFLERLGYAHLVHLGAALAPPVATAGGGSRSQVWNAVRATVLGVPLVLAARAETSFGACLLAAAGSVHGSLSEATGAMVQRGHEVEPVDGERDRLEESYRRFVAAVEERGWLGAGLREAALTPLGP